jgi:glutamate N-acetyltransferase / amino-acid N-acetyltransferase
MSHACRGFRFGAVSAGIKSSDALDLALLECDRTASAAAIFTRNRVKAAPVVLSRARLARAGGRARALVVNSGNANACTGRAGMRDAEHTTTLAAAALGLEPEQVLVASTGVIGHRLPMDRVEAGVPRAAAALRASGFDDFAAAILTTDKRAKVARRTVQLGHSRVTMLGCTKGAGMIAPNMATTLTFVVTDARVPPARLAPALHHAAAGTFNAISVDGDTSTNDMLLVLAGGAAGNGPLRGRASVRFQEALTDLLDELAHALMRDGEGVHHVVTIRVRGARTETTARQVARRVANSPLVKTAIAGGDPNWGRVLCAAGNAGVPLTAERLDLFFDRVQLVSRGVAVTDDRVEAQAAAVMAQPSYEIVLDLNRGSAEARYLACDLSHEYVSINADYRT